jgi:hypothetical protein
MMQASALYQSWQKQLFTLSLQLFPVHLYKFYITAHCNQNPNLRRNRNRFPPRALHSTSTEEKKKKLVT